MFMVPRPLEKFLDLALGLAALEVLRDRHSDPSDDGLPDVGDRGPGLDEVPLMLESELRAPAQDERQSVRVMGSEAPVRGPPGDHRMIQEGSLASFTLFSFPRK